MAVRRTTLGAVALAASCVLASGCSSLGSPTAGTSGGAAKSKASRSAATTAATTAAPTPLSPLATARRAHEYPAAHAVPEHVRAAAASPMGALERFAARYINWNATTVSQHMRALARSSIGQARSEMQLAAANTAQDYELRRGGIANSGTVEAVAPLPGGHYRYVVVTLERTTATNTNAYDGLRPAWHLTLATVAQEGARAWVVSSWLPEN